MLLLPGLAGVSPAGGPAWQPGPGFRASWGRVEPFQAGPLPQEVSFGDVPTAGDPSASPLVLPGVPAQRAVPEGLDPGLASHAQTFLPRPQEPAAALSPWTCPKEQGSALRPWGICWPDPAPSSFPGPLLGEGAVRLGSLPCRGRALPHVLFYFGACGQIFLNPEGRAGSAEQWSCGPAALLCRVPPRGWGAASVPLLRG